MRYGRSECDADFVNMDLALDTSLSGKLAAHSAPVLFGADFHFVQTFPFKYPFLSASGNRSIAYRSMVRGIVL